MELVLGLVFVLMVALIVGGLGLLIGRSLSSKVDNLAEHQDDSRVSEDE
jgi:hypothetical protein